MDVEFIYVKIIFHLRYVYLHKRSDVTRVKDLALL
jgi:hypothetical protein